MANFDIGCEEDWTAQIVDRFTGTEVEVGTPARISGAYGLDQITQGRVEYPKPGGCCYALGDVRAWRHRLDQYRAGVLAWSGPIVGRRETRSGMVFRAVDLLGWTRARWLGDTTSITGASGDLAAQILLRTLSNPLDPIGWQSAIEAGTDSRSVTWAKAQTGWDILRGLLDTSIDLYAAGDTIHTVPTNRVSVATLTEQHFTDNIETDEDGFGFATRTIAASDTTIGTAGGVDPWWGLIDRVTTEKTVTDPAVTALALLVAARSNGPLLQSTGGQILPGTPIMWADLRPGTVLTLDIPDRCIPLTSTFEITAVSWSIGGGISGAVRGPGGKFATTAGVGAENVSATFRQVTL